MHLILHIGTEKTGSTALQTYLETHRDALAASGFALPDFLDSSNHRELASVFIRDEADDEYLQVQNIVDPAERAKRRALLIEKLATQVERDRHQLHTMLISSEHFHSRLLEADEVNRFIGTIKPLFRSIRVLCYLRRQELMALSFYTQKLRGGFVPPSILPMQGVRARRPGLPPYFDFESLLDRWAGAVGEQSVEPKIYERSKMVSGDVIADFFAQIGCQLPAVPKKDALNKSFSAAGQLAFLAFNGALSKGSRSASDLDVLRARLDRYLQDAAPGEPLLPSRADADEFAAAFEESNRRVARRWFDQDELFSEPRPDYPERETDRDWKKAAQLLALFSAHVSV